MLSTNYLHPYQPMMAKLTHTQAPTILPPTTNMNCLFFQSVLPSVVTSNFPHAQSHVTSHPTFHQLCVQQWNHDSMDIKLHELAVILKRCRIDIALIQETKLSQEDPTQQIPDINSGKRQHQSGGLMVYNRQGVQNSVPSCATTNPMDFKRSSSTWLGDVNQPLQMSTFPHIVLATPPTTKMTSHGSIIYQKSLDSSLGTHNYSWDEYVSTDPHGSEIHDWMEAHSKIVLNDGSPTQAARGDQSAGISMPDVSPVDMVMAERFSWETIPDLGSHHLLLLLIWDKDLKVERDHNRKCLKYPKQIGLISTNALITVSMQCYQSGTCEKVWRPSVTSKKG